MSAPSPAEALAAVQKSAPLVHVITNTLSQNDCANLLLAAGARPIMAEAEEEAAEIARNCGALVLNTGIPSAAKFRAMLAAGQAAGRAGIPILLDPVGIGVSAFRREQIGRLLETLRFAVIRGNSAEISVLAGDNPAFSGVDSGMAEDTHLAQLAARRFGAVILQSGGIDFLTDGRHTLRIPGGHPAMAKITGAGCMLSALTGAFLAASGGGRGGFLGKMRRAGGRAHGGPERGARQPAYVSTGRRQPDGTRSAGRILGSRARVRADRKANLP